MKTLKLSADLSLPIEAVTQKFAFLGKNGSGKTYGASKLAELMLDAGAQIVALDPVGVWYGLRLAADGKSPGIRIPVFGGLYGDLPLQPTAEAGALVADVIVDRGISAVIDVSQFEHDADRVRFCIAFARRIFFRKKAAPSAIHIFMEEAQEFLPQNPMGGEKDVLHEFLRIAKIGRNYGFGMSLISQRPQEINKKALNLTEVVLAFQTNGTHERKAIAEWVRDKGADVDIVDLLPKLKVGRAHAWSPTWLEISEEIHIAEKRTFNASATPKVGATAVEARPLAPIDLEKLKLDMAATIEKKKAEDPAELKKQLAERDRQIRQLQSGQAVKTVDKPVVDQAAIDRAVDRALSSMRTRVESEAKPIRRALVSVASSAQSIIDALRPAIARIDEGLLHSNGNALHAAAAVAVRPERQVATVSAQPRAERPRRAESRQAMPEGGDLNLTPSKLRVLNALAAFESLGIDSVVKVNCAFFAGYTENGHFNNMLGELRTAGLLDYPTPGMVALTEAGREIASADSHPITSISELHETWFRKLSPSEGKLLRELISVYPDQVEKSALAEQCGYTVNGHFNNMLGHLRTLGAIDYPTPGFAAATDVLFPEGLS